MAIARAWPIKSRIEVSTLSSTLSRVRVEVMLRWNSSTSRCEDWMRESSAPATGSSDIIFILRSVVARAWARDKSPRRARIPCSAVWNSIDWVMRIGSSILRRPAP